MGRGESAALFMYLSGDWPPWTVGPSLVTLVDVAGLARGVAAGRSDVRASTMAGSVTRTDRSIL